MDELCYSELLEDISKDFREREEASKHNFDSHLNAY